MARCIAPALLIALLPACRAEPVAEPANKADANSVAPSAEVVTPTPAPTPARVSQFTNLDPATCRMIEENREEGPYWRRSCPGAGGFSVEWTESDLRQGLELIGADGRRTDLRLSDLVAGGAFNHLGPRIEWRGETGAQPDRLVVRMFVANGTDPSAPDRSMLAVVRLQPDACLIAIVDPAPGQSAAARQIAGAPSAPCIQG